MLTGGTGTSFPVSSQHFPSLGAGRLCTWYLAQRWGDGTTLYSCYSALPSHIRHVTRLKVLTYHVQFYVWSTYCTVQYTSNAVLHLPLRPSSAGPSSLIRSQASQRQRLALHGSSSTEPPILPPCARRALKNQHVSAGDMLTASLSACQSRSVFRAARSRHKGRQLWQHRTSWRARPGGVAYHSSSLALDVSEPESFEIPSGSAGIVTVECVSLLHISASPSYLYHPKPLAVDLSRLSQFDCFAVQLASRA